MCIDVTVLLLAVVNLALLSDSIASAHADDRPASSTWWNAVTYCTFNAVTLLAIGLCRALPALCRVSSRAGTHRFAKSALFTRPRDVSSALCIGC